MSSKFNLIRLEAFNLQIKPPHFANPSRMKFFRSEQVVYGKGVEDVFLSICREKPVERELSSRNKLLNRQIQNCFKDYASVSIRVLICCMKEIGVHRWFWLCHSLGQGPWSRDAKVYLLSVCLSYLLRKNQKSRFPLDIFCCSCPSQKTSSFITQREIVYTR